MTVGDELTDGRSVGNVVGNIETVGGADGRAVGDAVGNCEMVGLVEGLT